MNTPEVHKNMKRRAQHVFFSKTQSHALFFVFFASIALIAVFLRFYRVPEYLMFLSDQGRDAIVLKRLITLEKLVFVGPTTSIGNVFTGPFYYYLVAPFLFLSRLDPSGPAYGVALINSVGLIGISWFFVKRFGKLMGLIFLGFAGLSATQIMQSRYSWNPNPVPFFTFITLIFWFKAIETKKMLFFILTGLFFGFCLQLHYITIVLLIPFVIESGIQLWKQTKITAHHKTQNWKRITAYMASFTSAFTFTFTPLILFEIKNKFITLQTFLRASGTGEVQAKNTPYISRLGDTFVSFLEHVALVKLPVSFAVLFLIGVFTVVAYILIRGKKFAGGRLFVWCLLIIAGNLLALARLETGRHVHYFNPSYWPLYALVAFCIAFVYHIMHSKVGKAFIVIAVCIFFGWYVRVQASSLYFLTDRFKPYTQVSHAKAVAQYIMNQKTSDQYQVVGLPFFETEGHYRYFLEYLGHRPMPADTLGDPKELFVICHELDKPDCDIPGNPQWQIADFQNRHPDWKVESKKLVGEVRIFKLIYKTR